MTTSWRARLAGILSAAVMTAGLLTVTAAPASAAAMKCHYDGFSFNACLIIEYAGDGRWDVSVGFDRYMPTSYAAEILSCPGGGQFTSVLWGDDGGYPEDDYQGNLFVVSGYPRSGSNPNGLFAEFHRTRMNLNEDSGTDKIYADITYFDCHTGGRRTYRTGTHVGNF